VNCERGQEPEVCQFITLINTCIYPLAATVQQSVSNRPASAFSWPSTISVVILPFQTRRAGMSIRMTGMSIRRR
jgi:hypothetical protein